MRSPGWQARARGHLLHPCASVLTPLVPAPRLSQKETILKMGLTEMQKKYHAALLQKDLDALKGGADRSRLLNVVMQLRKCCNHPYLFQGAEPGPPYITGEHLIQNSGKMVLLDKLLPKLKERGSRVLIFSQMTRLLDILEDYCLYRGYKYSRIDGNTSGEDREMMIDTYNAPGSEKFIFLLSTRAGGLGINLVTADTVVLYDSDWNPQMDLQAMDRAHRIGQTREVSVFRLCTDGTIEEKVIEKAYKKLRLDALVIQQGRLTQNTKSMNKEELLNMVRYGAERIFSGESSDITDEDIEAIIKKGEKETAQLNDKMKEFAEGAMKFSLHGDLSVYDYKADDEDKMSRKEAFSSLKTIISASWVDPPKRHRKTNYSDTDYFKSTMGGGGGGKKKEASLVKRTVVSDFQFYNRKRINELYDKVGGEAGPAPGRGSAARMARAATLPCPSTPGHCPGSCHPCAFAATVLCALDHGTSFTVPRRDVGPRLPPLPCRRRPSCATSTGPRRRRTSCASRASPRRT